MQFQQLQRDHIERPLVRCFEVHRTCCTRFGRCSPRCCANAPLVARFQAGEVEMRGSRHEIVAGILGKMEEVFVHDATHRVHPTIVLVRVAAPITVPSREWVDRAWFERVTMHVQ